MSALGSDSWVSAGDYDEGDELHTRAIDFVENVDWKRLTEIASSLRNGTKCTLSEKYSVGHFNLVRKLVFEDGVSWIARLRLPLLQNVFGTREALDVASSMRIEIATAKLLRQQTTIPVPEIFSHNLHQENEVGAPYMLMRYINGNVAAELQSAMDLDLSMFGTPEQDERFWDQMADIQVQLASLRFDKIGSLYEQEDGSFAIGPELETGKGPWASASEYYQNLANHVRSVAEKDASPDIRENPSFYGIPDCFPELMQAVGDASQREFGLVNRDFGTHNVLVNSSFEIIGLIDLDGVMAAAIKKVAQLPLFMGAQREPPGVSETRPAAIERIKEYAHLVPRYTDLVRRKEATRLADELVSDAASVIQGLNAYGQHSRFENERWWKAYEELLAKRGETRSE